MVNLITESKSMRYSPLYMTGDTVSPVITQFEESLKQEQMVRLSPGADCRRISLNLEAIRAEYDLRAILRAKMPAVVKKVSMIYYNMSKIE